MKITALKIKNFRNIRNLEMNDIPNLVILAGPNGTGKSSILDAILFAKESIAPYYGSGRSLFEIINRNTVTTNENHMEIVIKFHLSFEEIEFLKQNGFPKPEENPVLEIQHDGNGTRRNAPQELVTILSTLDRRNLREIGMVEPIDAHRIFPPLQIENFNVDFTDKEVKERRMLTGQSKFNHLKRLLLKWKLQDLQQIQKLLNENKITQHNKEQTNLQKTKKVFELLTPKEFDDVAIDSFPIKYNVKTPSGIIDIDNLSSGEKEILFVFTELVDLNLKNSIILFDEPDLHLNEKLQYKVIPFIQGLGSNNQIWIVTHSTAIINSVETRSIFRINEFDGKNQISPVMDSDGKMDLFYEIVGSKSILTLGEKIVFLEGIESSDKFLLEMWSSVGNNKLVFVSAL